MHSTKPLLMGRGSITTSHGQIKILKHATPDLLTYIQKAVQTGVYRSNEEINEMNQKLKEQPTDLRRVRWNIPRGSKIQDYPKEYEILSLNPPLPFKPKIPIKQQRKIYNKHLQNNRPMDKLVNKYLSRESHKQTTGSGNSEPVSADQYYRRLLGSNKANKSNFHTAMGTKSATLSRAYAVAVKQYEFMRTENLSEQDALARVEELLSKENLKEKTTSRNKAEQYHNQTNVGKEDTIVERGQKVFPDTRPAKEIIKDMQKSLDPQQPRRDDHNLALLYSNSQMSFEGMIQWTRRLQAIPYRQWSVGASTALDHWIAKRVLGLSEETWLSLLEGQSPELLGRGRDIIMAREALFPETILDGQPLDTREDDVMRASEKDDNEEESIEDILATLAGWSSSTGNKDDEMIIDTTKQSFDEFSYDTILTNELQEWRSKNVETPYDKWSSEEKQKFTTWLQDFVSSLVPDSALDNVDLDETRKKILVFPPDSKEKANQFWDNLKDETSAEIFLQQLLEGHNNNDKEDGHKPHPFFELQYQTQLERLINLGTIREIANEYNSEDQRSKFLSRYGDYLLEGVKFSYLVPNPNGPIKGADVGKHLQDKYNIELTDRFSLKRIQYGQEDEFDSEESIQRARELYKAWNQLKAGRANYEEKLFQKGKLGLRYNDDVTDK